VGEEVHEAAALLLLATSPRDENVEEWESVNARWL